MPKVQTYKSQAPIPTGVGASLIQNPAALTNTGEGAVLNATANLASGIGSIIVGLSQKAQAFDDVIASSDLARTSKKAELNYQAKIEQDPDTNNHYKYLEEYKQEVATASTGLKWGTKQAQQKAGVNSEANMDIFASRAEMGIIKQKSKEALIVSGANLEEAILSDDGSKQGALEASVALENYEKALKMSYPQEVAEVVMEDTLEKLEFKKISNAVSLDPEIAIKLINKELELRRKGKGSKEYANLEDVQLQKLKSHANSVIATNNSIQNKAYKESEGEVYDSYVDGSLTIGKLDSVRESNTIDDSTHKAYTKLLENRILENTDEILTDKWINGNLTLDDVNVAYKSGRLNSSNVYSAWKSRVSSGSVFNVSLYDEGLAMTREVRTDKGKYESVRKWQLENANELGSQYAELRKTLETNMNAKPSGKTAYITRSHKNVTDYFKDNVDMTSLDSIREQEVIHSAIDARAEEYTPTQMADYVQALLLPHQEAEVIGAFSTGRLTERLTGLFGVKSAYEKSKPAVMAIQTTPISEAEFKNTFRALEKLYGEDDAHAQAYFDKYKWLFTAEAE